MAAIDLLFDVKRDSERLHQLVIGALLQQTMLLSRLVPLEGTPTQLQLQFQPEGYDLSIALGFDGPGKTQVRRGRVFVEIKLNSPVNEDQLAQQCSPTRLHADDRLLYLLLGYSMITSDRARLRERVRRLGEHTGRPELLDRVSLRDADELIPLLADPALLPGGPAHRDARDLAAAYRDALLALADRTRHFANRPVSEWQMGDFFGFFAACRSRGIASLGRARIARVAGGAGGESSVVSCTFAETPLPGGLGMLDLQFDNRRLVLRLHATADRKELQKRVLDALAASGLLLGGERGGEPDGGAELLFEPAPLRRAATMTVAQIEGMLDGSPERLDWGRFTTRMLAAEAALRKVVARIGP